MPKIQGSEFYVKKLAVCFCLFLVSALAQTDRGTITGTISDPVGAVVPNAAIEVKNTDSGLTYSAGSTGTGNFTLAQIPAGTYELTVTVAGFKKYARPGIVVPVAQTVRVDATLEVGAASETVTINAEAPVLKTESGELSHNITYNDADALPLFNMNGTGGALGNIRDPLSIVSILPGASFSTDDLLRINGMPSSTQAVRVEGQDATNGMWRQLNQANQQGVEAIQEVSVQTSNFAAEYGQVGGGYFNYTMKSGTNQFHGSAYDYFQNEFLNAATPFTDNGNGGHLKNALRRNDYGFTFGGPVVIPKVYNGKDKTFFFFNFEQFLQNTLTTTTIATMPTAAERAGNFSGATFFLPVGFGGGPGGGPIADPLGRVFPTYTIFDPTTARPVNGQQVEDPFPGGIIPTSRLDPVALKFQALFPLATMPGNVANYPVPAYTNNRHTTIPSIKVDQNLNSRMKLSGYYSQTHTTSPNSNGFPANLAPATPTDDRAQTTRVNFDDTITPTLLLHLGVGLLYYNHPQVAPTYDQSTLWAPNQQFPANFLMPSLGGLNSILEGGLALGSGFGAPAPGVAAFSSYELKEIKPTSNANMTWVKGNHTFKWGGEMVLDGFPQQSNSRANGIYGFAGTETQNPWEVSNPGVGIFTSGFPYASFLLGSVDSLQTSAITDSRLGNHAFGFFAQDNWKISKKFTLEIGLRYDYANLLQEQYGRMQSASFTTPNPAAGGLPGNVLYQATCNCDFSHSYKFAFGPRLGVAYQFAPRTVLRMGAGIAYSTSPNNAFLSLSVPDFQTISAPLGTGQGIQATFAQGNPYAPGNVFGNPVLTYPNFAAHYPNQTSASGCGPTGLTPCVPPESPFISISPNTGRLPRIFQWSIGLQHEIRQGLVIEANYVGNRGTWWTAPVLDAQAYNALTPAGLAATRQYGATQGINTNNPADLTLLTDLISNPAVIARFPLLANPNNVYPGFPSYETLGQALRPQPQWNGVPPFLGPPMGDTWYDSLQVQLTKRYSHGLSLQGSYTFQKELTNGTGSDTSYFTPGTPIINDVFNLKQNKQVSSLDHPEVLVITFNYTTPQAKFLGSSGFGKAMQWIARDWTLGGVLRYQSGQILQSPPSNNNFLNQLQRGSANNPALWGGGTTLENYVPGQPFFSVDPNSHFDPTKTLVLNPNAWTEAPPGTFGVSAPYYINNRWQRQPAESLSVGRIFRIKERYTLQIRAEFFNVFNRVFFSLPANGAGTNSTTAPAYNNPNGALSAGYGFVNTLNGAGTQPRTGQLVARFQF
jgi:hypothetical protein